MAVRWNRLETWLTLGLAGAGLLVLGVAGLWIFMSATSTPIHPDAQGVSSVGQADPAAAWGHAASASRQIIRATVAEQNLPGISVAVGIDHTIVWAEGFGWADIEKKTPVTPTTPFRIGTASIPLTAAAAGLLLDQNKLKLDDEIRTFVPEFPAKPWPVTLAQLMGHTAGVITDGGDEGPLFGTHCDRPVDALPAFADRELRFEPGTGYYYSRFSFIPVSAAIETAGGEPFLIFMRTRVFEPLGMHDTFADSLAEPAAHQATSYFPRFAADPRYGPDVMRPLDYSCYAGASAFVSTPTDLVRFAMGLANGALLRSSTLQRLQTTQRLPSGQKTGYGLGWDLETVPFLNGHARTIGHDGELLGGMVSSLTSFPDHGITVAVVSNISYADTAGLSVKIAESFAQQKR